MHVETVSTLLALLSYTKKNTATKRIATPVAAEEIEEDPHGYELCCGRNGFDAVCFICCGGNLRSYPKGVNHADFLGCGWDTDLRLRGGMRTWRKRLPPCARRQECAAREEKIARQRG